MIRDEDVLHLAVEPRALRVGRPHEHDGRRAEPRGEVRRPRIAADDAGRPLEHESELLEAHAADEIDGRDLRRALDARGRLGFDGAAANEHGDAPLLVEPVRECGEVLRGPAFRRPARAHDERDVGIFHARARLREERLRRLLRALRHAKRHAHLAHRATDGARDVEIALDDMRLRVRPDDRRRDELAALAHVPHAVFPPLRRGSEIGDGRRLEEPLQVEHGIVAARLQLLLERSELPQEAAQGAEFLFLEDDDLIDTGVHRDDVIGGRLDDPGDARLRVRFLDSVGNGKRMNHIADRAELDDEDVLHGSLASSWIFSMTCVVERPATIGTKATRPPQRRTTSASGRGFPS